MQTTFATRTFIHGPRAARRVGSSAPLKAAVPRLPVSRRCQVGGTTMILIEALKSIIHILFILSRRSLFLLSSEVAAMMEVTNSSSKRETPSILTCTSSVSLLE